MKINLGQILLGIFIGITVSFFVMNSNSILEGLKEKEKKEPKPSSTNMIPREESHGDTCLNENEKSLATATIFIASIPPVASVSMDGKYVGKTNISEIQVIPGKRKMKFWKGNYVKEMVMEFEEGKNPSQMVRLELVHGE